MPTRHQLVELPASRQVLVVEDVASAEPVAQLGLQLGEGCLLQGRKNFVSPLKLCSRSVAADGPHLAAAATFPPVNSLRSGTYSRRRGWR